MVQEHPWVTKNGEDPLMSKEENVSVVVEPPTPIEVNHAITHNIGNLVFIVRSLSQARNIS